MWYYKIMDYSNLYRSYQIQAAEVVLDPNEQYYYRKICRWYSKTFHTPLNQVELLPMDHVLTNYYESTMESIPYNELYDIVIDDFLPEIQKENEDDLNEFIKILEEEQREKQKLKSLKSGSITENNKKTNKASKKQQSLNHNDQSGTVSDLTPDINITFDDEEL